jgi:hypothetical protein
MLQFQTEWIRIMFVGEEQVLPVGLDVMAYPSVRIEEKMN